MDELVSLARGRTFDGAPLTPGFNVDKVDIAAGLAMMRQVGYDDAFSEMVITYALQRHAKGEEAAAERTAIGQGSDDKCGTVSLTCWRMILAAACS